MDIALESDDTDYGCPVRRHDGFVAIEFLLAVVLLLFPVVMIVAGVQVWIERRYVATLVARDAAAHAAEYFPAEVDSGEAIGDVVAATYGVDAKDVDVDVFSEDRRGRQVRAEATIEMPALVVPFVGSFGTWRLTTGHTLRIDDYRSRTS